MIHNQANRQSDKNNLVNIKQLAADKKLIKKCNFNNLS